jgi:hypothetical protein
MTKLKPHIPESERIPKEDTLEVGQWYWVKDHERDWYPDRGKDGEYGEWYEKPWLGCIVHIGSNYIKIEGIDIYNRIHIENFDEECTRELDPDAVIQGHVEEHRGEVARLLNTIKALTAKLGLTPKGELPAEVSEGSQALVVAHGTKNIKAHKAALILAKEDTLPDLFEQVRKQHKEMASWMEAQMIPMKAELKNLKTSTKTIEDRIFTVELYAGLIEDLVQLKKGKPAPNATKVSLFQRRHYMDEECLAQYEAGGMDYRNIEAFDRWLMRKKNRDRILPLSRCVVAFQVRRNSKQRNATSIRAFIRIMEEECADKMTFLYIRNGGNYYRLSTGIDFGEQLFPDRDHSTLLGGGGLWMDTSWSRIEQVISQGEYEGIMESRAEDEAEYETKMKEWKKLSKKQRKGKCKPWYNRPREHWVPCTPESVYYDDAMRLIAREAVAHNRVAVVLQGLLDRSSAFHPHPPWRLWEPEGFAQGIHLVYDQTRALVDGDAPDFKAYQTGLNKKITKESWTVGQQDYWERVEAKKENERMADDWRVRDFYPHTHYAPYGNPGPGLIAQVVRLSRDKMKCTFMWMRERRRYSWKNGDSDIRTRIICPASKLLNVSAYTPGDFHIFFDDPRTRMEYLKWAPLLLAAEDWHAKKGKEKQ